MKKGKKVPKKKNIKRKPVKKNVYVSRHGKKEKKVKVRYGRIFVFLFFLILFGYLIINYVKIPVKNIIISGNETIQDQEIIDKAGLRNYPSVLSFTTNQVEQKLEKNIFIKNATVIKKNRTIIIGIEENYGLFYNNNTKKSVMLDGSEIGDNLNIPILLNYVTEDVYKLFVEKMKQLDRNIINRIAEIKYEPNDVDEERFLFIMTDGNYAYITLEKIMSINDYVNIIKTFENKKGILYLDSGEYFEVFAN